MKSERLSQRSTQCQLVSHLCHANSTEAAVHLLEEVDGTGTSLYDPVIDTDQELASCTEQALLCSEAGTHDNCDKNAPRHNDTVKTDRHGSPCSGCVLMGRHKSETCSKHQPFGSL